MVCRVSCLAKESSTIELIVTLSGGGVRRDQLAVPHGRWLIYWKYFCIRGRERQGSPSTLNPQHPCKCVAPNNAFLIPALHRRSYCCFVERFVTTTHKLYNCNIISILLYSNTCLYRSDIYYGAGRRRWVGWLVGWIIRVSKAKIDWRERETKLWQWTTHKSQYIESTRRTKSKTKDQSSFSTPRRPRQFLLFILREIWLNCKLQ